MKDKLTVNNTITCNCKIEDYTDELDFILVNDIFGKENADKIYDELGPNFIYKGKDYPNSPVKIETLKKMLSELEDKGCNYVSIDYHCDHIEYDIFGLDVHSSTEKEIEEYENKERNEMLQKTSKLREAAKKYIEEAEKIEKTLK